MISWPVSLGIRNRAAIDRLASVEDDTATALREMVELADCFPGQYKPEFELGYWAGVAAGAERWWVRFEGDIRDHEFTVLGHSPAEALRSAAREARERIA